MALDTNKNYSTENKRLAKNTFVLYLRMILTVGISFYTTRLVLANLGVEDYGTYNVIGGFVSMFYMLTSTMTGAVGRFLAFEQGSGKLERLKATFYSSFNLLLLLSLVVILIGETFGLWFLNNKLTIGQNRLFAANWVYQFTLMSFLLEMISVPYNASIVAHEKMGTFAFVTISKVLLNLCVALLLSISPIDKLIFYGLSFCLIGVVVQIMYWGYCKRHFAECQYQFGIEKSVFKNMIGYAGWSFITVISSMMSTQGINILLNMQFGSVVNAARGVASQISSQAGAFSKNFTMALNPQITKSYAAGDYEHSNMLVYQGAKYSYLLFLMIALPCMLEIDFVLKIWLKEVPKYCGFFVQLNMLYTLMDVLLGTSLTLNNSIGKIRNYQILISSTQFMIVIFSYIIMKVTNNPVWTVAVTNIIYLVIFIPRIQMNKKYTGISSSVFCKIVLLPVLFVTFAAWLPSYVMHRAMSFGWNRLFVVTGVSIVSLAFFAYAYALTASERNSVKEFIFNRIKVS